MRPLLDSVQGSLGTQSPRALVGPVCPHGDGYSTAPRRAPEPHTAAHPDLCAGGEHGWADHADTRVHTGAGFYEKDNGGHGRCQAGVWCERICLLEDSGDQVGEWTLQARGHGYGQRGGEDTSVKGQWNGSRARWQVSVTLSSWEWRRLLGNAFPQRRE